MSERVEVVGGGVASQSDDAGSTTAGALLKKYREDAGLHIGALAVALKVPVSKLEALESGGLTQLSGPVFVRALASSVCRTLKVDPAAVLQHLPQAETAHLHQKGDLNEPFRGEGRGIHFSASERLLKPSALVVIALIVGAFVLMFLPNLRSLWGSASERAGAVSSPAAAVTSVPTEPVASVPAPGPSTVLESAPVPARLPAMPAPAPVAPVSGGFTGEPAAALARPDVNAVGSSGILSFKALGSTWVEVIDGKGAAVFRKTLTAGEVAQVGGVPPLKATVGRADLTEVSVRGTRLELQTLAKDNVARFEVKQ